MPAHDRSSLCQAYDVRGRLGEELNGDVAWR